jgi:voltage-gated potassium channel
MGIIRNIMSYLYRERYKHVFISLVLLILLPPFLLNLPYLKYFIYILLTLVLLTCFIIVFGHSKKGKLATIISFSILSYLWSVMVTSNGNIVFSLANNLILASFFLITFRKIVIEIFSLERVTFQVVLGAIGAYLLLGLTGAFLFEIVELLYPNSFTNAAVFSGFYAEIYLSFITISTLGYGDITPISPQGQAASIFVSISGQLYLTILMAMLVGKFLKDTDW